jgi:hypothetical protein
MRVPLSRSLLGRHPWPGRHNASHPPRPIVAQTCAARLAHLFAAGNSLTGFFRFGYHQMLSVNR